MIRLGGLDRNGRFHGWFAVLMIVLLPLGPVRAQESAPATDPAATAEVDELGEILAGGIPDDIDDLRAMQERIRKLSEQVIPCTVGIQVGAAQGSGVIISEDGYVLTAGHVVGAPDRNVTFVLHNGRRVKGKTLGSNTGIDSGLMKITADGPWPHMEMAGDALLKPGQWVIAAGHPGGYVRGRKPVIRLGRVLAHAPQGIRTDCTLVGGDSGGPLFDMDGRVVGINSRIGGPLTANIHVPIATYHETWDRLAAAESWGPAGSSGAFLGVASDPEAENAKIAEVVPGSPAEQAGIKPGDVITKFDGKPVSSFSELQQRVARMKPGDKVKVEVERDGKTKTLEVELARRG